MKYRMNFGALIRFPFAWLRERRLRKLTQEALALMEMGAGRLPDFDVKLALWLLRSKDHVNVWLNVTAFYEEAARSLHYPELGQIAVAIDDRPTDTSTVAPIERMRPQPRRWNRAPQIALLAAGIAAAAVGTFWLRTSDDGDTQQYTTELGENRLVRLKDGTAVHLNTSSRIAVSFTRDRRVVDLLAGEALFDIGRDSRPFRVRSGSAIIEDIGTRFDVRVDAHRLDVTVIEGQVRIGIAPPSGSAGSTQWPRALVDTLNAGERVSIPLHAVTLEPPVVELASEEVLGRRMAWTHGMLQFQGESLSEAVREFNRYNVRQLRIVDPQIGELRIGGQFLSTSPDRFARALHTWGVAAVEPPVGAPLDAPIELSKTHAD